MTATPLADPANLTRIVRGMSVIRKTDRKKARPIIGTVLRVYETKGHYRDTIRGFSWVAGGQCAVVEWHGNVRYLSGRTDQRSKIKTDALVPVCFTCKTTAATVSLGPVPYCAECAALIQRMDAINA